MLQYFMHLLKIGSVASLDQQIKLVSPYGLSPINRYVIVK